MFKKILVTGASGFIGSWLTRRFVEEGYNVAVTMRPDSSTTRIDKILKRISVFNLDLEDTANVNRAFKEFQPEVIYHLATYYTVEHKLNEIPTLIKTNVLGTVNLLEAAKNASSKLFVNTSSCFVYKNKDTALKETDDLTPINLYAETKLQAEEACTYYADKYGLPTVTFRLFPPYGPADNERKLIPFLIKSFLQGKSPDLTSGKQQWDFINVQDIVNAYLCLLSRDFKPTHEFFNIGTGKAVSVKEVAETIAKILNSPIVPSWGKVPHRKNEVWFTSADINKAKILLNWQPQTSLQEGLVDTIAWYRNKWKLES
jgi:UDP-glucose 4-epimerase